MALAQWYPMADLMRMREAMNRLSQPFGAPGDGEEGAWGHATWVPPVDIYETEDAYVLEAELPGVTKDDIDIEFGSWPHLIPLANCLTADGLRDQFLKSRGPRLGEWSLHEPIPNTHKVDGCCRQHMLEMRFRFPNIPGVP